MKGRAAIGLKRESKETYRFSKDVPGGGVADGIGLKPKHSGTQQAPRLVVLLIERVRLKQGVGGSLPSDTSSLQSAKDH